MVFLQNIDMDICNYLLLSSSLEMVEKIFSIPEQFTSVSLNLKVFSSKYNTRTLRPSKKVSVCENPGEHGNFTGQAGNSFFSNFQTFVTPILLLVT